MSYGGHAPDTRAGAYRPDPDEERCTCSEVDDSGGSATTEDDPNCPIHGDLSWGAAAYADRMEDVERDREELE